MDVCCVSILLPVFNGAATLNACLASIMRQTFVAWECVLVDDGSTDGTREIAEAAAARDERFRVVATPHRGLVAALNGGLEQCRAPFVARMDADDVMHRHRLDLQMAALEAEPALAAVGCHVRIFPRRTMSARRREYESWLNAIRSSGDVAREAFVECPAAHPSLMLRRAAIASGYADHGWPEDYDLLLRLLTSGKRVGMVPQRLLGWRHSRDSHSRTNKSYADERFTACKAHYLARSFLRDVDQYVLWGYGGTGRALRRALAEHDKTPSHIVEVKPSRLGERIHDAPVVPPMALDELRGRRLVVSVARLQPRTEIRAALAQMQFVEERDYICAA